MSNQNSSSISKDFAATLVKELKVVNRDIIKEVTRNNDLINSIIKIYDLSEEDIDDGEFTNTLSKSPNVAYGYTYHEFDEDGCYDHSCCECEFGDLEEDDIPCVNCSNINATSHDCYHEYKEEHDPRPIKSYDGIYEPISHAYLEIHKAEDCNHSISTCKNCEFHSTKENHVPCVGCKCLNHETGICFHMDNKN